MTARDPGLQPERTELAWRRTALAFALGCLVSMRLLPAALGNVLWVVPGFLGLVATGGLWLGAQRRYRRFEAALDGGRRADLPDGRLLLALAGLTTIAALVGVAVVFALRF
ncbi:DUF202 domain-containing protein [Microbacterium sp. AZCO]|uniref:DUF202 domain-containing protein n=1 Tax=Microbacterium sp. AZCO TaxID=3142976 RepID=UPI0031F34502